jgi:hypothetical protein
LFSHLYRLPYPPSTGELNRLELVTVLPAGLITAADISPAGTKIIVRTMTKAYLWERDPNTSLAQALRRIPLRLPIQKELQGEAIGFDPDGMGYYTIGEGRNPVIYYFLPQAGQKETSPAVDSTDPAG